MTANRLLELPLRHTALFLLALGALLYLPALGQRDLWYPDEPDIGEVTVAMYESGDWIVPRRMGRIWVDYPPMTYWAGALMSHLTGGVSEFSLRLSSTLAAIALVLVTASAGGRWFDRRTGLWAGLALLTFLQFAYEAVCLRPDMLFALYLAGGLLLYASAFGERVRWGPRIGGFALLGLAILSKGPLGLLLPGLVLALWHASRREWRRLFELAPLSLVALAVALPWYISCAVAMGPESMLNELWGQNFERFTGSSFGQRDRGHVQPFGYYLKNVWADLFPWSFLLPSTIWWVVRSGRWRDRNVQLALWWASAFLVFLSFAVTKRQIYLLPAYPAAALMLGLWLSRVGRGGADGLQPDPRHARVAGMVFAGAMALVGALAMVGGTATEWVIGRFELDALEAELAMGLRWHLQALAVVALAAAIWIGVLLYRGGVRRVVRAMTATMAVLWLVVSVLVTPGLNPAKGYSVGGAWIADHVPANEPVGLVNGRWDHGWRKMGGIGFYSRRPVDLLEDRRELQRFFREHPDSLVLVYESLTEETFGTNQTEWRSRIVGEIRVGRYRYFAVKAPAGSRGAQARGAL